MKKIISILIIALTFLLQFSVSSQSLIITDVTSTTANSCDKVVSTAKITSSIYYNLNYTVNITYTNTVTNAIHTNTTNMIPPVCSGGGGGCSNLSFIVTFPAFTLPAGNYNVVVSANNGPTSGVSSQYNQGIVYPKFSASFQGLSNIFCGKADITIFYSVPNVGGAVSVSLGTSESYTVSSPSSGTLTFHNVDVVDGDNNFTVYPSCSNCSSSCSSNTLIPIPITFYQHIPSMNLGLSVTTAWRRDCSNINNALLGITIISPVNTGSYSISFLGNNYYLSGTGSTTSGTIYFTPPSNNIDIPITVTQIGSSCTGNAISNFTPSNFDIVSPTFTRNCDGNGGTLTYTLTGATNASITGEYTSNNGIVQFTGASPINIPTGINSITSITVRQGSCSATRPVPPPTTTSSNVTISSAYWQSNGCNLSGGCLQITHNAVGAFDLLDENGNVINNCSSIRPNSVRIRQGNCISNSMGVNDIDGPRILTVSGTLTTNTCTNSSSLYISANVSGNFEVLFRRNNGTQGSLGFQSIPNTLNNVGSVSEIKIQGGSCSSDWQAVSHSSISDTDFEIDFGSYWYCDPRGSAPTQDGTLYVKLKATDPNTPVNLSGNFEVWDASPGATPVLLFVATAVNGTLTGRVPTFLPPSPNDTFIYRRQIFRAKVNRVGSTCQTPDGTIDQTSRRMGVLVEPSANSVVCLPSGDQITLNFTISNAQFIAPYEDKIFIVHAKYIKDPCIGASCANTVINEIQNIPATFIDNAAGVYKFSVTLSARAPLKLIGFAVTHRSGDNKQPAGQFGSNCYQDPVPYPVTFMPYLPPPTAQFGSNCGTTFSGDIIFDPLICNIFPKEWEIIGTSSSGTSTVLQTLSSFSPATGMSCKTTVSFSTTSNIQSLSLRHKLTGCSTPIIINGGGGVGNPVPSTIEVVPYGDNCGGGYQLIAPAGYDNYVWYPGNQTTQSIFVTQAGNYRVTMSRNTGSCYGINAQVTVGAPPVPPALTASVTYRDCNTADIRAVDGFTSYTWYNSLGEEVAQTQNMLGVTITDTYRVVARKGACTKEFEVVVNFSDLQLFAYPNGDCSNYQLVASPGFTSYLWSNGATSSSITVSVDGTYTVTATRGTCTQTATATVNGVNGTVSVSQNITKLVIPNVLATSASTFSEQWLRTGSPLIVSPSGFGNGQRGIWKPHETYAYITGRQRATNSLGELITPNVDKDGVFELSLFNWKYHGVLTCPEWIKTQQVTQYNAANFEIENKDILDRYTSALYGYQQQLPIATAGNARADEIAFESFEEYANSTIAITDVSSNDNNLDLLTESSSAAITNYQWLSVELGLPKTSNQEHLVYVKGRVFTDSDNNNITNFPINNVFIKGYRFDDQNPGVFIWRANIKASKYLENRDMTQLVLTTQAGEVEPYCYWKGELAISKSSNLELVVNATMSLQNQQKHTGKKALKIQKLQSTDTKLLEFNPKRLHLIPKKKYVLSAWVKLASSDPCNGETSFSKSIPQTGMIEEIPPVDFPPSDFPPSETEDPQNPTDPLPCSGTPYSVRKKDYSYQLETPIETMVNLVSFSFLTPGNRSQIAATNTTYSDVIEGWVRIEHEFIAEHEQVIIELNNKNENLNILYLDDIRIHPFNSALQTYVYDTQNYKLRATLDGNNFSSLYFYDEQGNLYLTKKETERGIQTIQEALSHQKQR